MGLMAQFVNRLGVMYAGRLVEVSPVREIFAEPLHPYTRLLIASLPSLEERGKFQAIPGLPPSLLDPIRGCSFHPRCPYAMPRCSVEDPKLREVRPNRQVACFLFDEPVNGAAV
jgi:peptide/nickel transport system ATP-binding protein